MKLGIPAGVDTPLAKRLAGLTFFRLLVLALFLGIIELYYSRATAFGGYSSVVALTTAGAAFMLSAIYALLLRRGRGLVGVAHAQLITDQFTWTIIVYISGAATSGASSLYGLTCLSGAILIGTRGAITAALAGAASYLSLCAAMAYGWLTPPPDQTPEAYVIDAAQMVYPAFSTVMAIAVVTMLGAYLSERLRAFGGRLEDVTKRAEQAERLAALGRLSAGLAHEIRNPLGSIRGSIELLRTGRALGEEDKRLCLIIERETARLNDLVVDMLDLSRPREPERGEIDLVGTARSVVDLANSSGRGGDVDVRYDGVEELSIRADANQMRQVLWNLVRNAMQVSSAGDAVRVRLRRDPSGDAFMEVTDAGPGIPDSTREHLFDAFFTTRSKGAGIGLAVVKQLADGHDFDIVVDSAEGSGTTFSVRIPKAHVLTSLLVALLCGCSGRAWIDQGRYDTVIDDDSDWSQPDRRTSATSAAPTATSGVTASSAGAVGKPAPRASLREHNKGWSDDPVKLTLRGNSGTYRNTYYDFPDEQAMAGGPTAQVFTASCAPIATVSQAFHDAVCVQGSGKLRSGQTISFAKRGCECARTCPRTDQKICFEALDKTAFPFGRGAMGTAITPLRTVAVDSAIIPLGTPLYIPMYQGLRDLAGQPHDGCFIAQDRGLRVTGKHVDIFTGSPRLTEAWNRAVPSNRGVRVVVGGSRCGYLAGKRR